MQPTDKMHDLMARHVERGIMPGLVALVGRRGAVEVEVLGTKAAGEKDPMRRDTLFRVASMSKPVTAAAAMTLVDDGTLRLDDPVTAYLPELADRRVLVRIDAPLEETVPARRGITLRDLLTFRLGFGIVWGPPDGTPIQRAARALHLGAFGPPHPQEPPAPDEWMRRFATLPLMHQPGERWMYNTGSEVLSVLVARAAGKPLPAVLRERIFEPLGMNDTSFAVPREKLERLATSYMASDAFHPDEGGFSLYDSVEGEWSREPAFPSGAGGLVSTADDFLAFGEMLLARGEYRSSRVLSVASVDAMTRDQLTVEEKVRSEFYPPGYWSNHGWGFGTAIVTGADEFSATPGRFGWDGGLGTSFWMDPSRQMVGILMTQRAAFPPMAGVYRDFWRAAYGMG